MMLYPCMLCVSLLMCLFVLWVACLTGMFCLSAISMMFVKIMLAVCMLVGMLV